MKDIIMDWSKDAGIPISENSEENFFDLQDLWSGEMLTRIEIGKSNWKGQLKSHQNWAFKLIPII